jgi:hypothetical protein
MAAAIAEAQVQILPKTDLQNLAQTTKPICSWRCAI